MKNKTLIFLFVFFQLVAINANAKNDFFEERYRGWLWFENKPLTVNKKTPMLNSEQNPDIAPAQA